jgi:hypothetical protein
MNPGYCVHRVSLSKMLIARGGFAPRETLAAFYGLRGHNADGGPLVCSSADRAEIERRIATWLMRELQKLPKGKTTPEESSPVRRRGLISRLEIADVAIALLDYPHYYDFARGWGTAETDTPPVALHLPTPELIELLGQLQGVARHRAALASAQMKPDKFSLAARIDAQAALRGQTLTAERLAKLAGVSTYCTSIWRRSEKYKKIVASEVAWEVEHPCHPPDPDIPDF